MLKILNFATFAALRAVPITVQARGVFGGMERGAAEGNAAAGPVGGVVGGAVGGVNGVLGIHPRDHRHWAYERRSVYRHHRHHRHYYGCGA